MNSLLISIIIPIYNVERYLPKCLNSVICQTYSNLDIVLVDDGSSDKSGIICDEYAQKDSRIQVLHKKNEGVDKARFSGLNIANGDYVIFVDSDDWLCDNDILRKMVVKAEETRADYVEMGMQRVIDKHGLIKHVSKKAIGSVV